MSWALLALALTADESEPPQPDLEPRAALWLQPLGSAVGPFLAPRLIYLALGATAVTPGGVELALEVSLWQSQTDAFGRDGDRDIRRAVTAAIGPVFHMGDTALRGFFIEPKAIVEVGQQFTIDGFTSTFASRSLGDFYTVQVGFTAGWQYRAGRFFFALSFGASAGFGSRPNTTLGPVVFGGVPGTRGVGFMWGLDVNHLRIGIAI